MTEENEQVLENLEDELYSFGEGIEDNLYEMLENRFGEINMTDGCGYNVLYDDEGTAEGIEFYYIITFPPDNSR